MRRVEGQAGLLLARSPRAPEQAEVSLEVIGRKRTLLEAVNFCIEVSGLDDKEVALALDIDTGHFSNIRRGKPGVNFPLDKLDSLMTLCGNDIPLIWLAQKRGKGVHMLESEAQRLLRLERERGIELEKENRLMKDLLQGRVTAA